MSEDFNDNKTIQAQSSEAIQGGGSGVGVDADMLDLQKSQIKTYIMDIVL